MKFLQRLFPPLAFFGGFAWDALTIGQRVKPLDLWVLGAFLLAAGSLIPWLARREAKGLVAPAGVGWQAPYLLLQFFFGGIFFHGFSEMLYEFTSSAANNGSGFEGLGDATPFWNIMCGLVMIPGRFIPIIGPIAIAGSLASKKYIPESAGTLKIDSVAFIAVLLSVIIIIAVLSFFPALDLGPLAEFFSL